MLDSSIHFLEQAALLAGQATVVLGLLTLLGAGLVWLCFPRHAALRWPIYAPLTGLALLTLIGLPLSLLGLPVAQFITACVLAAGGLTAAMLVRLGRREGGRRLLGAFLRRRGLASAGVLLTVVSASTVLITWTGRTTVSDIWGSSDFSAYWIVADYLQQHGATAAAYHAQPDFVASDIVDHLQQHARLGCMVSLAAISAILHPDSTHQVIIPLIVACMVLLLALLQCWLEQERLPARCLLVGLLLHPFLYFLLYFTYVSQATGVVLFLTGLLLVAPAAPRRIQFGLAGAFVGAAILHYPPILIPALLFWGFCLLFAWRDKDSRWAPGLGVAAMCLVCLPYAPQTYYELHWAATLPVPPGWDWRGLLGALEFAGLRSVLGYDMPEDRPAWLRLLDLSLMMMLAFGLWRGLRQWRLSAQAWSLVAATSILVLLGTLKFLQHVPHATHAIAKGLSLFALPLLVLATVPFLRVLIGRRALQRSLLASLCVAQGAALLRSEPLQPLFTHDFVQVARRSATRAPAVLIVLPDGTTRQKLAPIIRDERRLITHTNLPDGVQAYFLRSGNELTSPSTQARIIDREGRAYVESATAE